MELKEDKIEVKIENEKVVVSRVVVEVFEIEEYLRRLQQMGQQEEMANKQIAQTKKMSEEFSIVKEQAEKISEKLRVEAKEEREKAENESSNN